jgi:hypothetical protein
MAIGTPSRVKLFTNGNSLMASDANHTMTGVRYIPMTIYTNLLALNYDVALFDYSKGSQKQSEINVIMASQINANTCGANDIVLIWEITNDLGIIQTVTAQDAINNLQAYINYVSQFTQKYIVCTCAARDFTTDLVTLMPKIDTVNTWIRTEYNPINICDIAANSNFDVKAKASISPPYDPDKLHLLQAGCDAVIGLLQPKIEYFLNN